MALRPHFEQNTHTADEPRSIPADNESELLLLELPVVDTHAESHDENIWEHMTPAHQAELKAEDSDAWMHVVGLLLLIISVGLVLAVGTALFSGVLSVSL